MSQITLYSLSSSKMNGQIILTYHDGKLYNVLLKLNAALTEDQFEHLINNLPYDEEWLKRKGCGALTISTFQEQPANQKVAMFCASYKKNLGINYRCSAKDAGMIKSFEVTEMLLNTYFKSNSVLFKNKYSIGNYCKFFNQLRAEAMGASRLDSKFPDYWSESFAKKCSGRELSTYFTHLNGLGLKPKRDRFNNIIDFIPYAQAPTSDNPQE